MLRKIKKVIFLLLRLNILKTSIAIINLKDFILKNYNIINLA